MTPINSNTDQTQPQSLRLNMNQRERTPPQETGPPAQPSTSAEPTVRSPGQQSDTLALAARQQTQQPPAQALPASAGDTELDIGVPESLRILVGNVQSQVSASTGAAPPLASAAAATQTAQTVKSQLLADRGRAVSTQANSTPSGVLGLLRLLSA